MKRIKIKKRKKSVIKLTAGQSLLGSCLDPKYVYAYQESGFLSISKCLRNFYTIKIRKNITKFCHLIDLSPDFTQQWRPDFDLLNHRLDVPGIDRISIIFFSFEVAYVIVLLEKAVILAWHSLINFIHFFY